MYRHWSSHLTLDPNWSCSLRSIKSCRLHQGSPLNLSVLCCRLHQGSPLNLSVLCWLYILFRFLNTLFCFEPSVRSCLFLSGKFLCLSNHVRCMSDLNISLARIVHESDFLRKAEILLYLVFILIQSSFRYDDTWRSLLHLLASWILWRHVARSLHSLIFFSALLRRFSLLGILWLLRWRLRRRDPRRRHLRLLQRIFAELLCLDSLQRFFNVLARRSLRLSFCLGTR